MSLQYPPYLECKSFPLPLQSPTFNVDCFKFPTLFCLASDTDKEEGGGGGGGEGGCSVRDNRYINDAPRW